MPLFSFLKNGTSVNTYSLQVNFECVKISVLTGWENIPLILALTEKSLITKFLLGCSSFHPDFFSSRGKIDKTF